MAFVVKDGDGTNRNLPLYDRVYGYSLNFAPGANPTDIIQLQGSATTIVRVKRLGLVLRSGTAAGGSGYTCILRSTAASGGTATTPTISAAMYDSADAAPTAVLKHFTAAPTAGSAIGPALRAGALGHSATTADVAVDKLEWTFGGAGDKPVVLRGTSEFFCVAMTTALATAQTLHYYIEWEEGSA